MTTPSSPEPASPTPSTEPTPEVADGPPKPAPELPSDNNRREIPDGTGVGCGVFFIGLGFFVFAERVGWISPELNWLRPLILVSIGFMFLANEILAAWIHRSDE